MGNTIIQINRKNIPDDNQSISLAIETLFDFKDPLNNGYQFQSALRIINKQLLIHEMIVIGEQSKLSVNGILLKIWYGHNSQQMLKHIFEYWLKKQNKIFKTNILLFKMTDLFFIWEIVKFFLMLTDKRNSTILNNIHFYKLTTQTEIIKNIIQIQQIKTKRNNLIDSLSLQECLNAIHLILQSFSILIQLNDKVITRSQFTLKYITEYCENCFMLFCKIYLHTIHFKQIHQASLVSNPQKIIQICAYFLGNSIQKKNTELYQLCIIILLSFINDKQLKKNMKGFPSHLFKHIPVIKNNIFEFIFISILFVLEQDKIQKNEQKHMKCNRFHSFRVLVSLIENQYVQFSNLSHFYLENICIHINVVEIERIYMIKLIKKALKLKNSNILEKFLQSEDCQFKLNFPNRKISIKGNQIQSYLQNIFQELPTQIIYYAQRYIYGCLYKKIVIPIWSQDYLWTTIIQKYKQSLREKQQ